MYLRTKLQQRAHSNLDIRAKQKYPGMRVTKGYVASELLTNYKSYIRDKDKLKKAIVESDIKEEGGGIAVNLNITNDANEKLKEVKLVLDNETGRSLFPAQILDILLICAINSGDETENVNIKDIPDKELAKALMDYAYKLLTEQTFSVSVMNAKPELINVLMKNNLI
ncbi:hypothetical protein ACTNBN_13945 [Lachnospiraceae bacterium HCP1S3_B1]